MKHRRVIEWVVCGCGCEQVLTTGFWPTAVAKTDEVKMPPYVVVVVVIDRTQSLITDHWCCLSLLCLLWLVLVVWYSVMQKCQTVFKQFYDSHTKYVMRAYYIHDRQLTVIMSYDVLTDCRGADLIWLIDCSNRVLTWLHNLGVVTITGYFSKRKTDLVVTAIQAAILMAFNDISTEDVSIEQLTQYVLSVCHRLLLCVVVGLVGCVFGVLIAVYVL